MPPHAKPSVFRHSSPWKKIFGTRACPYFCANRYFACIQLPVVVDFLRF